MNNKQLTFPYSTRCSEGREISDISEGI